MSADSPVASAEARIAYMQAVLKVKADQIATLELMLETRTLEGQLRQTQLENQLKVLEDVSKEIRVRIPIASLEWIEYRKLPWWKRIFRRNPAKKGAGNGKKFLG